MLEPIISATFNGAPGLSFVQGEDRTIAIEMRDLAAAGPLDLTGSVLRVAFLAAAGGSIRRSNGALVMAPAALSVSTGVFTKADHGLVSGDPVTFTTAGTLPSPLAVSTPYLVVVIDPNTFSLTDASGNPIPTTTAPIGNLSMTVTGDMVLASPLTSGLATLTLRALVTSAVQPGLSQSFQVELIQSNRMRVIIEANELDVYPQVAL